MSKINALIIVLSCTAIHAMQDSSNKRQKAAADYQMTRQPLITDYFSHKKSAVATKPVVTFYSHLLLQSSINAITTKLARLSLEQQPTGPITALHFLQSKNTQQVANLTKRSPVARLKEFAQEKRK